MSRECKQFTFLFIARSPVGNLRAIAKSLPRDVDLSDGDLVYYWSTKAKYFETAIDRAIKRCLWLGERPELARCSIDWKFDVEFDVKVGDQLHTTYFNDDEVATKKLYDLNLL